MNPEDYTKYREALHAAVLGACDNYTGDAADGYELAEHLATADIEPIYTYDAELFIECVAEHSMLTAMTLAIDVATGAARRVGAALASIEVARILLRAGLTGIAYLIAEDAEKHPGTAVGDLLRRRLQAEPWLLLELCLDYDY